MGYFIAGHISKTVDTFYIKFSPNVLKNIPLRWSAFLNTLYERF